MTFLHVRSPALVQLGRASQRAEREAGERRDAERRLAALTQELAAARAQMASAASTRSSEESERLSRDIHGREIHRRLEGALADRAALEATVHELRSEVEVLAQRLEAEARARAALSDGASLAERELAEQRERQAHQREAMANAADAQRELELAAREAQRASDQSASDAAEARSALREAQSEVELLQRRHAAESEARQGLQAAEQLRSEELGQAQRAAESARRLVDEMRASERELASGVESYRAQLQTVLAERVEMEREMRALASVAEQAKARAQESDRALSEARTAAQRTADELRELRALHDAAVARERMGEAQRSELSEAAERLRVRLEAECRARALLEDSLRLRQATRSAAGPPPHHAPHHSALPPPVAPSPVAPSLVPARAPAARASAAPPPAGEGAPYAYGRSCGAEGGTATASIVREVGAGAAAALPTNGGGPRVGESPAIGGGFSYAEAGSSPAPGGSMAGGSMGGGSMGGGSMLEGIRDDLNLRSAAAWDRDRTPEERTPSPPVWPTAGLQSPPQPTRLYERLPDCAHFPI